MLYNKKTGEWLRKQRYRGDYIWIENYQYADIWTGSKGLMHTIGKSVGKGIEENEYKIIKFQLVDTENTEEKYNRTPLTRYVEICPFVINEDKVLLVHKNKKGTLHFERDRLSLIGGVRQQIHGNLQDAAEYYLKYNSNLEMESPPRLVGLVYDTVQNNIVQYYQCETYVCDVPVNLDESEHVGWWDWDEVKENSALTENLKIIIPLMKAGVTDWVIRQHFSDFNVTFSKGTPDENLFVQ